MTHFARALALFVALALTPTVSNAQDAAAAEPKFKTLYHFTGNGPDGGRAPQAGLAIDKAGNLYGTTVAGGTGKTCGSMRCGTVFKLAKPAAHRTVWKHTVLHHFKDGSDGALPFSALLIDSKGALFGTANIGGHAGTVFRLMPKSDGSFKFSVLHEFQGGKKDGEFPSGDVAADATGALYVTAQSGGANDDGVIIKLTPPAKGNVYTPQLLHSFKESVGKSPMTGLLVDSKEVIYGTTDEGGNGQVGVLFRLAPPVSGKGPWAYKVLHHFAGYPSDGQFGRGTLVKQGARLYGTTAQGGKNNAGAIFSYKLPTSADPAGTYKLVHSFDFTEAMQVYSNLTVVGGSLYGVAESGGANSKGSVFKFTPASGGKKASLTVVHSFSGSDGEAPYGGVAAGKDGTIYGTTSRGGKHGFGTAFSIKP